MGLWLIQVFPNRTPTVSEGTCSSAERSVWIV